MLVCAHHFVGLSTLKRAEMFRILISLGLCLQPAVCVLHQLTFSSPLQVHASLGAIHKAIDRAISLSDHRAGHDTASWNEEAQETITAEAEMALGPQLPASTAADLAFVSFFN